MQRGKEGKIGYNCACLTRLNGWKGVKSRALGAMCDMFAMRCHEGGTKGDEDNRRLCTYDDDGDGGGSLGVCHFYEEIG